LGRYFALDATKASDMVLAVNEAMANVAEFAYVMVEQPGAMHVLASYDETAATLTVTVTDEGAWRNAAPVTTGSRRGRGIPLMQALADHATVESSASGTRVCLEWGRVAPAQARCQDRGSRTT
jgi:anti-sigma regulatory factor (Ser/Thr protein kinase)